MYFRQKNNISHYKRTATLSYFEIKIKYFFWELIIFLWRRQRDSLAPLCHHERMRRICRFSDYNNHLEHIMFNFIILLFIIIITYLILKIFTVYRCPYCQSRYINRRKDMETKKDYKVYICSACGKEYEKKDIFYKE